MLLVRLLPACAVKDPPFARGPARLLCLSLSVSVLCLHRVHHSPEFPSGFLLPLTSFVTCASVVPSWVFLSQADPDQYMVLLVRPCCVTLRIFQSTVVCTILGAVLTRQGPPLVLVREGGVLGSEGRARRPAPRPTVCILALDGSAPPSTQKEVRFLSSRWEKNITDF